ncbi:FecR family protein [Cyclobacterium lianum]|uniref:FecR family protein n=1 Tax=Cyclobacterium lianum TaxID=388280 RepID=A0A1M7LGK8_9BACT|nr:FecR family protein [Cyclobacterium lianum]SHM76787.1 FecR family protein [Cyclobacterium lianum]
MTKEEFLKLLRKKESGSISEYENALLLQVLDKLQERQLSWELAGREEEEVRKRIRSRIGQKIDVKKTKESLYPSLRVAASLILSISFGFLLYSIYLPERQVIWEERTTNERQKASIILPDGSLAYLNTNTSLRFPKTFANGKREVALTGEAFFEVVADKDAPFEVISQGIKTVVLGTAFNVRAHPDSAVRVAVQSGKVAVFHQEAKPGTAPVELLPRQMAIARANREEILVENLATDAFLDWKAGAISFDMDPFDQVIQRLASIYNYTIEINGVGMDQCQIKATYANGNLFAVLYGLKNLVEFEVENTGERTLRITYNKCKM